MSWLEQIIFVFWGAWSRVFLLWPESSLCYFSFFPLPTTFHSLSCVFCLFLNTFPQRHHQLYWWAQLYPAEGPLWSQLCPAQGSLWPLLTQNTTAALPLSKPFHLHPTQYYISVYFFKSMAIDHSAYSWRHSETLAKHTTASFWAMINTLKYFTS